LETLKKEYKLTNYEYSLMRKNSKIWLLIWTAALFSACVRFEDSFTDSIFVDEPELDPASELYPFDRWLEENYLKPYNLDFRYRMQDKGSDMDYNLVPAKLENSLEMAILVKHLWFEAYNDVAGPDFLKQHGPRIIHLIGSAAYKPALQTMVLGTAEAGIKITLYNCNELNPKNIDLLNEYYFETMHHEFAHILHQKKTYPKEFETFSAGYYDPSYWQERTDSEAASLGFASPYGSSQPREDFVEIIANYIVKDSVWWTDRLRMASQSGVNRDGQVVDDPLDGQEIIEAKIDMCRKWLKESWDLDLDSLRRNVTKRQLQIDSALIEGYKKIDEYKNEQL
jgi:substrate import-associated zinc metallohydrolase lipoprotein